MEVSRSHGSVPETTSYGGIRMTNRDNAAGVHLVGSVPLADAEEVFRTTAAALGKRLRRIPDGETGERANWIMWQYPLLAEQPAFESMEPDPDEYVPVPRLRLRSDKTASDLDLSSGLGYADAARRSYELFTNLRDEGVIPEGIRFQVCLPTGLAPMIAFIVVDDGPAVEPVYEAAMIAERDSIIASIPAHDLAIQWDCSPEFAVIEGVYPHWLGDARVGVLERLVRLGSHIPEEVELGYHLCYGSAGNKHWKEPADATFLASVANGVTADLGRSLQWVHLPVPKEREDVAYFEPLGDLKLDPSTELYLGLVHIAGGVEGTRRRMATAREVLNGRTFGVSTECGLGPHPPEDLPELLRIEAEVADPVG